MTGIHPKNLLFLCTGNSARSILAEALLAREGRGKVQAFSAGSKPKGAPHPVALKLLDDLGYDRSAFSSKSWDIFAGEDAPKLDMVITLCASAAGETCPIWPGHPVQAHWGLPDPASCDGDEKAQYRAFARTYAALLERVNRLLILPLEDLEGADLREALQKIGDTAAQPNCEQET